jgi:hypothetical protein
LRFEVTLAGGQPLVRGEGRVVSYNQVAFRGEPGLLLRFTRLDPRSKEFVDRVAAIRRQEGMVSMAPAPMSEAPRAQESVSLSSTGEIGVLSSKLIVAASAFPLPVEPPHDATIAPPPAPPTEAPPPAMATMAAPPLMHMHSSTSPPEGTSSAPPAPTAPPSAGPRSAPPPSGAPRSRRSVPPPLPAAARRSSPPSARTSAPPPPPATLLEASPFEALREQVEARMARRPATPPPPPVVPAEVPPPPPPLARDLEPPALAPAPPVDVPPIPAQTPAPAVVTSVASVASAATTTTSSRTVTAPPNREDLLRRLRTRASAMPAAERAKILTPRAR